jgi:hypothetical protein
MARTQFIGAIFGLIVGAVLVGCGGTGQLGSGTQNNGNSNVVLAMTDSAPSGVTVLSAEVTLTGVTLTGVTPAPGNVSLFSGSTTVELTRLQTDVAYIATAMKIPAGPYTSVAVTFVNPSLTIENDTTAKIGTCSVGAICTITPAATPLSATVALSPFSIASSSTTGLLIDVNLANLLTSALSEDFSAGTTVVPFTPAGTGAPPVGAEDVVGHVVNVTAASNTFTLTNAEASYTLKVDSSSTFFQFPASATCTAPGFACLANNQIVSVDIAIQADGSLVARNILFEDADSSEAEVEGIVTGTNAPSKQFNMVVLTVSGTGTGLNIGSETTVQYSTSPQTPFDVDFVHADNFQVTTTSFLSLFTGPAGLVVGQQVSVRRNSSSTSILVADRVRLRSSRITATVQNVGAPNITLGGLPFLFSDQGTVMQIQAQTSVTPPTIYFDIDGSLSASSNILGDSVSVRGPLFNTGGANRTLVATKVVLQNP